LALINILFEYSFSVAKGTAGLPQECSLFRLPFVSINPSDTTDYADFTIRVQAENGEYIFVDNPLLGLPLASILYLLQEKLEHTLPLADADFVIEDFLIACNFTEPEIMFLKPEIIRLSNNPGSASSLAASPAPTPVSPFTRPIANIDIEQFYTMVEEYGAVIPGFTIYEEEEEVSGAAAAAAAVPVEVGRGFYEEGNVKKNEDSTYSIREHPVNDSQLSVMASPPRKSGVPPNLGTPPPSARGQGAPPAPAAAGGMGEEEAVSGKPPPSLSRLKLGEAVAAASSEQSMETSARRQKGGSRYKKTFKHGKSRKRTTYRKRV
jgi:hypothetical protein